MLLTSVLLAACGQPSQSSQAEGATDADQGGGDADVVVADAQRVYGDCFADVRRTPRAMVVSRTACDGAETRDATLQRLHPGQVFRFEVALLPGAALTALAKDILADDELSRRGVSVVSAGPAPGGRALIVTVRENDEEVRALLAQRYPQVPLRVTQGALRPAT